MKPIYLYYLFVLLTLVSCREEDLSNYVSALIPQAPPIDMEQWRDSVYHDSPLRQRHREAPLKILAIGNSFLNNATIHIPWLISQLNADSICFARLTRDGCSLQMHWTPHVKNSPDYDMYFSDAGSWIKEDISTIGAALTVMDWDIITIQQASYDSGVYSSYQPYLHNLIMLFRETASDIMIAWHATWPYGTGCEHPKFYRYYRDPEKMYYAIKEATAQASEEVDIMIPSTDLIWRMRSNYPEVSDGFSEDGIHITDVHARYALALLWYEVLISPYSGISGLDMNVFPYNVDPDFMLQVLSIVKDLTE